MAWSHVATSSLVSSTATSTTVTIPTEVIAGDLILLHCAGRNNSMNWAAGGYATLSGPNDNAGIADELLYRWATGSEAGGSITVTNAVGTNGWSVHAEVFRGGFGSGFPLDVAAGVDSTASASTTMTAPSVTPITSGTLIYRSFVSGDDNTHNAHSEGTLAHSYNSTLSTDHSCSASWLEQGPDTPTGTATAVQSVNGPDLWITRTLAFRPLIGVAGLLLPSPHTVSVDIPAPSVTVGITGGGYNLVPTPVPIAVSVPSGWVIEDTIDLEPLPVPILIDFPDPLFGGSVETVTLTPDPLPVVLLFTALDVYSITQPPSFVPETDFSAQILTPGVSLWTGNVHALPMWSEASARFDYDDDGTHTERTGGGATTTWETGVAGRNLHALALDPAFSALLLNSSYTPSSAGAIFLRYRPVTISALGHLWGNDSDAFEARLDVGGILYNDALKAGATTATTDDIAGDRWYSLLFEWDSVADVNRTYIDGTLVLTNTGATTVPAAGPLLIGDAKTPTEGSPVDGLLAAAYVWSRVLTSDERALISGDPWAMFRSAWVTPADGLEIKVDWDGSGFEAIDRYEVISLSYRRGAGADLEAQAPGSAVLELLNGEGTYTDTNTASPLYGRLWPGARVWATLRHEGVQYGFWSGFLADLAAQPAVVSAEAVCQDLLGYLATVEVEIDPAVGRTFGEYRLAILTAAGLTTDQIDLDDEGDLMGVGDYGRGYALDLLNAINEATGTRHFTRTGTTELTWVQYVTVNRWHKLSQAAFDTELTNLQHVEASLFGGWRTAWDSVINRQSVTVAHPPSYAPVAETVWEADVPISVPSGTTRTIWANSIGPVADAELVVAGTNIGPSDLTVFGDAAKIEITATGSDAVVTGLSIVGRPGTAGPNTTVTFSDAQSEDDYGRRDGVTRNGEGLTETDAYGLVEHMVWRYSEPRKQPSVGVIENREDTLGHDLFNIVGFTDSSVYTTDRRMEIVGEEAEAASNGLLTVKWQLQDTPTQTAIGQFIVDINIVGDALGEAP